MSYIPIDFVNKEAPFIEADNLNYMQQGIVLAVDRSKQLDDAWKDGSLKGKDGKDGKDGAKGEDGKNFEIDGIVALLEDLPTVSEHEGQIWLTNQFGHLHYSNGTEWLDWGQFTGIQGEKGDKGDPFNIDDLTPTQLQDLHAKLRPYDDIQIYSYQTFLEAGQTAQFQIADLNLDFYVYRNTATVMNYKAIPRNVEQPTLYYINRLTNYDLTAWESTVTTGYKAQAIPASGFVLDASAYLAGREQTHILIIDPVSNIQYSITFTGLYEGTMFIDVQKHVNPRRQIISPL